LVEVLAGDHVAVVGEVRVARPAQLERPAERDRPEAVEAMVAGQRASQPDVLQLPDRARREAVAAGLLPRVALLLDQQDVVAALGQPVGARRSPRPGPDAGGVGPGG